MTPTQKQAMEKALEWLKSGDFVYPTEIADNLRAALAEQPARCTKCNYQHGHQIGCENNPLDIALKALAEQADDKAVNMAPLSDEQIVDAYCKERGMRQYVEAYVAGARFAEAAHGIKGD